MKTKTVIVTGAGRGIGRATAVKLAELGTNIVAVARTKAQLDETKKSVESAGTQCLAIPADLTDVDQPSRTVEAALSRFNRIDALINNAGIAPLAPLTDTSLEMFDQTFAINNRAMFQLTQAVWPTMKNAGGGAIVNISSFASVARPGWSCRRRRGPWSGRRARGSGRAGPGRTCRRDG